MSIGVMRMKLTCPSCGQIFEKGSYGRGIRPVRGPKWYQASHESYPMICPNCGAEAEFTLVSKVIIFVVLFLGILFSVWAYFSALGWVALALTAGAAFILRSALSLREAKAEAMDIRRREKNQRS